MVTQVFFGIQVILFKDQRFFIKEPTDRQVAFLSALGLDSCKICAIPGKSFCWGRPACCNGSKLKEAEDVLVDA
jgi:hypothetical protein